ncbi:hypothetical protein FOXG_09469 [Fusarium oxysporum f. sp. lycopersici 4287]|uniref:Protein-lysine N-methyltransferase EFM4 n=2 Tax=Fusarium oxysporum TaxID=5507 RepID=A0A0J9VCA8_FUSO4|nr:hypothetical protein FOXG_09469 [Fusarium oxysporum f. sp. lycopersici 4287]KNB08708.1 hypothetical protein FOXG_09469 [Fusarium oxysporum f. sp. lycopersici 4287]
MSMDQKILNSFIPLEAQNNSSTMSSNEKPQHLEPSKLGTKQYWDDLYTNEITNHTADPSDIGTVWFDDSDAEAKILEFLDGLLDPSDPDSPVLSHDTTTFLDLGCGNGSLLFSLREEDWSARALGVDYSPQSIALARQIATTKDDLEKPVEFEEWDLIAGPYSPVLNGEQTEGWDVVLDKGTFDAISLSDEKDAQGRRLCECYRERVLPLVRKGGVFLVTSCNWTETELRGWFEKTSEEGFQVVGRVEYRSFSFGGHKGQTISTLCFRRV